jgi:cytochrome c oxidase subunit II
MIERFLPVAGSAHAADLDRVLLGVHAHMAVQAVAWGLFFLYVLVRFRQGANPRARRVGLRPLVPALAIAAVIAGDAILLATSALPAWLGRNMLPPALPAPLEIRVVSEQFAWNIHYPGPDGRFGRTGQAFIGAANPLGIDRSDPDAKDDIGLLNMMMLPLGRPVIVDLTSRDVIHSFTLNEMRVRLDATPGMTTRTWFTPVMVGRWDIACSQLCGLGHYRMRGEYTVMAPEQWDAWLRSEVDLLSR